MKKIGYIMAMLILTLPVSATSVSMGKSTSHNNLEKTSLRFYLNGTPINDSIVLKDNDRCTFVLVDENGHVVSMEENQRLSYTLLFRKCHTNEYSKAITIDRDISGNYGFTVTPDILGGRDIFMNEDMGNVSLLGTLYKEGFCPDAKISCDIMENNSGVFHMEHNVHLEVLPQLSQIKSITYKRNTDIDANEDYLVEIELKECGFVGGYFIVNQIASTNSVIYMSNAVQGKQTLGILTKGDVWCLCNDNNYGETYTDWMTVETSGIDKQESSSMASVRLKGNTVEVSCPPTPHHISIHDASGRCVFSAMTNSVCMATLSSGVYILRIISEMNKLETHKIIIR